MLHKRPMLKVFDDLKLQFPVCTKCGRMLEDTDRGFIVITPMCNDKERPLLQSSLLDSQVGFVFHRDVCDGEEIYMLDPVKILSERNLLPGLVISRGAIDKEKLRQELSKAGAKIIKFDYADEPTLFSLGLPFNID